MRFTSLRLARFRNYDSLELSPHPGITVLYGPNGSGKTNLLEAMHLLSVGRSHRTANDREMIAAGANVALVHGQTRRLDGAHEVEVRLYPLEKPKKRVLLYGKPAQRVADLMGHATTVMFSPEDLRIVRDGPVMRRRFLDMQLSQIRPSYLRALKTYLSVLERRNALLKQNRLAGVNDFANQLDTWDEQLAAACVPIVGARRWFLEELSRSARRAVRGHCRNAGRNVLAQLCRPSGAGPTHPTGICLRACTARARRTSSACSPPSVRTGTI